MRTKFLAAGLLMVSLLVSNGAEAALEKVGVIGIGGPELSAKDAEGKARTLKAGDDVFLNDDISSGNAKAQLIFLDRSTLTVNAGSQVKVDTFVYNPETTTGTLALSSVKGAMRFVGGHLSKKDPVTIKTPVATIGIRGGIVDTHVTAGSGATDSIFVYGKEMTLTNQNGKTVSTTQIGTGFNLASGSATPTQLPPSAVAERLGQFEGKGNSGDKKDEGGNGGHSDNSGTGGGNSNSDSGSGNGGGNSSASASDSGSSTNTASDATSSDTTTAAAANTSAVPPAAGSAVGDVGQSSRNDAVKQEVVNIVTGTTPPTTSTFVPNTSLAALQPAINTARNDLGLPPVQPTAPAAPGGATPPAALPPAAPVPPAASTSSSGGASQHVYALHGMNFNMVDDDNNAILLPGEISPEKLGLDLTAGNYVGVSTKVSDNTESPITLPTTMFGNGTVTTLSKANFIGLGGDLQYFEKGVTFSSASGAMNYYRIMDDTADGGQPDPFHYEVNQGVFGTTVAAVDMANAFTASATAPAAYNGVQFYTFLPDLAKPAEGVTPQLGLFDYNFYGYNGGGTPDNTIVNGARNTPISIPRPLQHDFGMAVDYNNKKFITGYIEFMDDDQEANGWDTDSHNRSSARVAFGDLNPNGNGQIGAAGALPYFDGVFLSYAGDGNTSIGNNTITNYGQVKVGHNVFANAAGQIEGFALDYEQGADGAAPSLFNAGSNAADRGTQLLTQAPAALSSQTTQAAAAANQDTGNFNGFMAGAMITNNGGTNNTPSLIESAYFQDVNLNVGGTPGNPDGNMSADFLVHDVDMNVAGSTFSAPSHKYTFGTSNGAKAAYISGKLNAAQLSEVRDNSNAVTASGQATQSSFIASNGAMTQNSTILAQCTQCTYTQWGVWAGSFSEAGLNKSANVVPYVVGRVASNIDAYTTSTPDISAYGSVAYNGVTYGTFIRDSGANKVITNVQGTMDANVDLAHHTINNLNMQYAGFMGTGQTLQISKVAGSTSIGYSPSPYFAMNNTDVTMTLGATPLTPLAGTNIKGSLFGNDPGNVGREIAGNYGVGFVNPGDTYTYTGAGIFQGRTTQPLK